VAAPTDVNEIGTTGLGDGGGISLCLMASGSEILDWVNEDFCLGTTAVINGVGTRVVAFTADGMEDSGGKGGGEVCLLVFSDKSIVGDHSCGASC
jgi:hypothetical protein